MNDLIKSAVYGHAIADALGVPVEFASREELDGSPVTGMEGYGTYPVPAGSWSDDTSMALCALDVLADGECDFDGIMENFVSWYEEGAFTPTGSTFDMGNTCSCAITKYERERIPATDCGGRDEFSNGNGSLMRIYPFVLYLYLRGMRDRLDIIGTASALTHAHRRSVIGCIIYAYVMWELIDGKGKDGVYAGLAKAREYLAGDGELDAYARIFEPGFASLTREEIRSSGYVVDTLEAALWCLLNGGSYKECVLLAVNLGDDTDTVGATAGALAGVLYGYDAIPEEWTEALQNRELIDGICERFEENNACIG